MRVPNVVAYAVLIGVLLGLYRFTSIGLDRTPEALPCSGTTCDNTAQVSLTRARSSPLHLLVPVELEGRRLTFLLDTGAETSVLARSGASQEDLLASRTVLGAVNARYGPMRVHRVGRLVVGGRVFGDFDMTIIDMAGIRAGLGSGVDGVLGADVLAKQTFEIDFERATLALQVDEPPGRSGPASTGAVASLDFVGGGWFVGAQANDRVATLLVDTGSNVTQIGERLATELGGVTVSKGRSLDASGQDGSSLSSVRLDSLEVAGIARRLMRVTVGDPPVLGADFFSGLVMRIDPEARELTLRSARPNDPVNP